ncbi:MAG TPA: TIGR04290 family methyltransferase [Tepidisphaeraceae bacterium]|jgi:tRNA (mo5U34)-methyltransferase
MNQTPALPANRVADDIASLGPWFHNLHLPDGTQTCPGHWLGDFPGFKWQEISAAIPARLDGWSCLDIGCNAGFYTFELAKRGATVLGIDVDERYLNQARWAAEQFGVADRVRFQRMQVYDLARLSQRFDLVLFLGVFYHLRYPMLGLDIVCQKVNRLLLFQTLTMPGTETFEQTWGRDFHDRHLLQEPGWPKMAFLEHGFAGDPTNWWAASSAACEAMLRAAGMRMLDKPAHEFFLCEPDPARPSAMTTWNAAEFQAATGLNESADLTNGAL